MNRQPDMLVVGGGVIGLSCAWRLAQAGLKVMLLERGTCGSGASGASLGALIPPSPSSAGAAALLQNYSLRLFPEFAKELENATGMDVGYMRCGRLEVLADAAARDDRARQIDAATAIWQDFTDGAPQSLMTADVAQQVEPNVNTGTAGALECNVSACVRVERLIEALQVACISAGVQIETGRSVTSLSIDNDSIDGVWCGQARVQADAVLVTAGVDTPGIAPVLKRYADVTPVRGQAALLNTSDRQFSRIIKRRSIYLIPMDEQHCLVGATTERKSGYRPRPTAAGINKLITGALDLAPALSDSSLVRFWAGLRPRPVGGRPCIGAVPGCRDLYVATGHYKTGIGSAPMTARLIVAAVTGQPADLPLDRFAPGA